MTYRIVIDQSLCSGFGTCAQLAPNVFSPRGRHGVAARRRDRRRRGARGRAACPMGAIFVEELRRPRERNRPDRRRRSRRARAARRRCAAPASTDGSCSPARSRCRRTSGRRCRSSSSPASATTCSCARTALGRARHRAPPRRPRPSVDVRGATLVGRRARSLGSPRPRDRRPPAPARWAADARRRARAARAARARARGSRSSAAASSAPRSRRRRAPRRAGHARRGWRRAPRATRSAARSATCSRDDAAPTASTSGYGTTDIPSTTSCSGPSASSRRAAWCPGSAPTAAAGRRCRASTPAATSPEPGTGPRPPDRRPRSPGRSSARIARTSTPPYVWSDQFGLRLQLVGDPAAATSVELDAGDWPSAPTTMTIPAPRATLLANRPPRSRPSGRSCPAA